MVESLMQEGMTAEEAADFISYNSSYRQGSEYPIIMNSIKDWGGNMIRYVEKTI